jgi:hypothetical protein
MIILNVLSTLILIGTHAIRARRECIEETNIVILIIRRRTKEKTTQETKSTKISRQKVSVIELIIW